jgi:hypothetical protein
LLRSALVVARPAERPYCLAILYRISSLKLTQDVVVYSLYLRSFRCTLIDVTDEHDANDVYYIEPPGINAVGFPRPLYLWLALYHHPCYLQALLQSYREFSWSETEGGQFPNAYRKWHDTYGKKTSLLLLSPFNYNTGWGKSRKVSTIVMMETDYF